MRAAKNENIFSVCACVQHLRYVTQLRALQWLYSKLAKKKKKSAPDVPFIQSFISVHFSATGGVWSVLTARRAAVEKVSGHVSFPLDFDEAAALQLVAFTG